MGFHEDLQRHIDQIKNRIPHVKGEEATKHALVVPLLQVFGFDVFDPREVKPEYTADFAKKKSSGQLEKIDYAVWLNEKPAIFVECKALDAKLEDHDGQLARYFNATPDVKVGILTNGVRLKVFTDLQQPNIMDATPWLDVDLLAIKPAEVEALRRFRKTDFAADQVVALAEEMVFYSAMTSLLSTQLREPSESFVRFVAGEIPAVGRVTAKVVERLTPILRKAIQATILDHVARSFAQPATEAAPQPTQPEPAASAPPSAPGIQEAPAKAGVNTTADELAAWESVATWVREVHPEAKVAYRDSKSYFTIHQDNLRKWWMRLSIEKAPYWIAFRHITADEIKRLAPGIEIIDAGTYGDSRVSLKSLSDLSKLRAAIIAAHQKEASRVADDGAAAPELPAS